MTDDIPHTHPPSDGALDAWQLLRMRRLASDASVWAATVEHQLAPIDIDALALGQTVTLEPEEIAEAVDAALALHDAADVLEHIAGSLRLRSERVAISAAGIEPEARAALAAGSSEAAYIVLAARLLPASIGLAALATALNDDPEVTKHWHGLTVGELLHAFRGCPTEAPAEICDRAGVDLADLWGTLDCKALLRLAAACEATG